MEEFLFDQMAWILVVDGENNQQRLVNLGKPVPSRRLGSAEKNTNSVTTLARMVRKVAYVFHVINTDLFNLQSCISYIIQVTQLITFHS